MSILKILRKSSANLTQIQPLCVCAMMLALRVVLGVFTNFTLAIVPFVKIGLSFLPIVVVAVLYGPVCAAIVGGAGDLLSIILANPTSFSIMPGITLCCIIEGLILGFVLYQKKASVKRLIIAFALDLVLCTLPLYTLALYAIMGMSYTELLLYRTAVLVPFAIVEVAASFIIIKATERLPVLNK